MTPMPFQTTRLTDKHERGAFECGEPVLDLYLQKQAGQDSRRGVSNTIVAVTPGSTEVLGFYSLSAYSVDLTSLPAAITKKLPRYGRIPAILLGRLAVHKKVQGQKLGGMLLYDALARSLSGEIGWALFLVHAKHEPAAAFYRRFEFCPFEHDPLALYIHRKSVEKLFPDAQL